MATIWNVGELEPALDVDKRGRAVDLGKRRRIARLADGDQPCAYALGGRELGLGLLLAA
jgi:hypothetical protein